MIPTFTAELGANWKGDFNLLEKMVRKCQEANVKAVKLQCLSQDLIDRHPELYYYKDCSVTKENINKIDFIANNYGMIWYATITDVSQIPLLYQHTPYAKIRAADSAKEDLVNAVLDTFDRTIISSSSPVSYGRPSKTYNLYCIPKYPTEFGEINFSMIKRMDGYSNHCLNPLAIFRAARMGAKYIEFHLTDSREEFAIDNKVSFTYEEMKEFMTWIEQR